MWDETALILDIDWAPDFVLRQVATRLVSRRVRATWFVTHATPVLAELAAAPDLFELGIHPNLLPGSSHGETAAEVLRRCLEWVPSARAMRTHGLVQSTALLDRVIRETDIDVDASLLLPRTSHLQPVEYFWAGRTLCRLPVFWEDDFEMERPRTEWGLAALRGEGPGLRIFAFHPIHVVLNGCDPSPYRALKARRPSLTEATPAEVTSLARSGPGPGSLFEELVEALAADGGGRYLSDIAAHWRREHAGPAQTSGSAAAAITGETRPTGGKDATE